MVVMISFLQDLSFGRLRMNAVQKSGFVTKRLTTLRCFNRIMRIHLRRFVNAKLLPRKMFFDLSLPSRWDWRSQLTGGART